MTSNLPTLPDGWELKKLGDIAEKIFAGGDKPEKYSEIQTEEYNIPIYANGIKDNGLFGYTDIHKVEEECITISARGTIGFSAIRNEKFFPIVRLIVVIPKKNILSAYLKYYFDSQITDNTGSSIPQLTVPMVKSKPIPLPPLEEQKRLVSLLDTLFAKIDRSIELLNENITAADALLPSALNTVFGELEEKWETKTIEDVVQIIDGDRGSNYPKKDEFFEDGYCLFLSAKNVTKNGFVFKDNQFITNEKDTLLRKGRLEKNDLVLTTRGTIGNIAIFDESVPYEIMRLNSGMVILRIFNQIITHRFLYVFLNSPSFENFLNEIQSGSAQPQISIKNLKSLQIPIPSHDIQTQTVAYLDIIREKVEILKQVQNDKKSRFIALKASILDRAFKGEL